MADVLAVRDEYRTQTWVMLIQECKQQWVDEAGVLPAAWDFREKLLLLALETA